MGQPKKIRFTRVNRFSAKAFHGGKEAGFGGLLGLNLCPFFKSFGFLLSLCAREVKRSTEDQRHMGSGSWAVPCQEHVCYPIPLNGMATVVCLLLALPEFPTKYSFSYGTGLSVNIREDCWRLPTDCQASSC